MNLDICPAHKIALIPTRTNATIVAAVCPTPTCDFHTKKEVDMTKVTIPANASKEARAKAIAEAAAAKKAKDVPATPVAKDAPKTPAEAESIKRAKTDAMVNARVAARKKDAEAKVDAKPEPKTEPKAKPEPKKKEKADPNLLSVSQVAQEIGIDPKQARAKLRRDGTRAPDGRWPKVLRDSEEHTELVSFLNGEQDDADESKEKASKKLAKKGAPAKVEPEEDDVEEEDDDNEEDEDEE